MVGWQVNYAKNYVAVIVYSKSTAVHVDRVRQQTEKFE